MTLDRGVAEHDRHLANRIARLERVIGTEAEDLAPETVVDVAARHHRRRNFDGRLLWRRLGGPGVRLRGRDRDEQSKRTGSVTHHRWTDLSRRTRFKALAMTADATPAMTATTSANGISGWMTARQTNTTALAVARSEAAM